MRFFLRVVVCLLLGVFVLSIPAAATPAPSGSRNSVVIVFKDGHKQSVDLADVERIDFKTPSMIVFKDGQSPAKQLLGMRVVKLRTASRATWGTMFVREVIAKPVIGILSWVTAGIVNFWLLWDPHKQELWDKIAGTIVVDDKHGQLLA